MKMNSDNFADYLEGLEKAQRVALEKLIGIIQETAPGAEEGFGYGLPAFRLHGKILVIFNAAKAHCALYPMSPQIIADHRKELETFDVSKGAIRFQPDHPLPASLVRRLIRARMEEISPD